MYIKFASSALLLDFQGVTQTECVYFVIQIIPISLPVSGPETLGPTVGFLGAERVLQRLRGVRGQDDATETGRRATPQTIVDIVRNRKLK